MTYKINFQNTPNPLFMRYFLHGPKITMFKEEESIIFLHGFSALTPYEKKKYYYAKMVGFGAG